MICSKEEHKMRKKDMCLDLMHFLLGNTHKIILGVQAFPSEHVCAQKNWNIVQINI